MTPAVALTSPKPYVMVVGVDYGKLADHAFAVGYGMCRLHPHAQLHVLSVVRDAQDSYLDAEANKDAPTYSLEASARTLAAHVDSLLDQQSPDPTSDIRVISHVMFDVPALAITSLAQALEADMIVVGTHGRRGLARWLLGSVAEAILRNATCPVFVVPPLGDDASPLASEKPCADCIEARASSGGRELWCERHRGHEGRRHTYHRLAAGGGKPA